MSIASEISRISQNVSDALTAIANKGVTVPSGSNSDDLATLIAQISGGSGGITVVETPDSHGGTIVTITGTAVTLQTKSNISPTESSQTIEPDSGYTGLSSVQINGISPTYVGSGITRRSSSDMSNSGPTVTAPAGYYESNASLTLPNATPYTAIYNDHFLTENNERKWVAYALTEVDPGEGDVPGWLPANYRETAEYKVSAVQANTTITPTKSTQTVGGANYMMEGAVTIAAIPDEYIIPSGTVYIDEAGTWTVKNYVTAIVAAGSATAPASISGSSASLTTGTNLITLTKTVSVTPSVTEGYIASGTAGNSTVSLSATVTTQAAQTIHPSTTDQTIGSGRYLTGTQTIKAVTVSGLNANSILSGTTVKIGDSTDDDCVASVSGSVTFSTIYSGSSAPSSSLGSNGDIYLQTGT